jgi:hypothetical protein
MPDGCLAHLQGYTSSLEKKIQRVEAERDALMKDAYYLADRFMHGFVRGEGMRDAAIRILEAAKAREK